MADKMEFLKEREKSSGSGSPPPSPIEKGSSADRSSAERTVEEREKRMSNNNCTLLNCYFLMFNTL